MPTEAGAASNCRGNREILLLRGTWPKRRWTRGDPLSWFLKQRSLRDFQGDFQQNRLAHLAFLIFQKYLLLPIPKENGFPFSSLTQQTLVLEVKMLNALISPRYLFFCCWALPLLRFRSHLGPFFPTCLITNNLSSGSSQPWLFLTSGFHKLLL